MPEMLQVDVTKTSDAAFLMWTVPIFRENTISVNMRFIYDTSLKLASSQTKVQLITYSTKQTEKKTRTKRWLRIFLYSEQFRLMHVI